MNKDGSEQTSNTDGETVAAECGPGCDCDTQGLSTNGKVLVCLVVGLAAATVLARGFMKKAGTGNNCNQQLFATALPVVQAEPAAESRAAEGVEKEETKATLWGDPLNSLASLNKVASEKDAVFVFLPAGTDEDISAARDQIASAATKIVSGGTTMAAFTLNKNAQDYTQITGQTPAPCVLVMVKGCGMSVVATKDITEANLLQALVAASRPSSCGPSACGPGAWP